MPEDMPAPTPTKPGWKTTEFWLTIAASVLSTVFASGVITNNTVLALAGIAATVLTALGYKVSRTLVKSAGAAIVLFMLVMPSSGCGTMRDRAAAGAGAALDCTAPAIVESLADLIELATPAVKQAIARDGSVDWGKLKDAADPLKTVLGRCAFATAIAIITTPTDAGSGAPLSAPEPLNAYELRSKFASARASWGVSMVHTKAGDL